MMFVQQNALSDDLHRVFVLLQVASKYWAPQTIGSHLDYDAGIVDQIYLQEIRGSKFTVRRIMMLEFSQYLENFLWPNYDPKTSSPYHVLSMIIMVNEKFRERVAAWQVKFPQFFTMSFYNTFFIKLSPFRYFKKAPNISPHCSNS